MLELNKIRTFLQNRILFLIQEIFFSLLIHGNNFNNNRVLIVRLDAMGDYILFRNFIEQLRKVPEYANTNLTLCGNVKWKQLAQELDSEFIDEFIWINTKKFFNNVIYRFDFLWKIYRLKFGVVIEPTFSREALYGDSIVRATNAKIRIGSSGESHARKEWKRKYITNKFYTKIIPASSAPKFEFLRNLEFFEKLLNKKIDLKSPYIRIEDLTSTFTHKKEYILLAIGAGTKDRKWSIKNYINLINWIMKETTYDIILVGDKNDFLESKRINRIFNNKIKNLIGSTSLPELLSVIYQARLIVTHDSAVLHISYILKKQFVCISNGKHFKRFHPYPDDTCNIYLYPWKESNLLGDKEFNKIRMGKGFNINKITTTEVTAGIKNLLKARRVC